MKAELLQKRAYGMDGSDGEVYEQDQTNAQDVGEPSDAHKTPQNPINMSRDYEAEEEFPELLNPPSRFPTGTRRHSG